MAQSNFPTPYAFEGEVSRPSSFQRALEDRVARRRLPARGDIRVFEGGEDQVIEQRVDELKEQMESLPMDERRELMDKLRETDSELYQAVVRRIAGRGKQVREALQRVEMMEDETRAIESDIHAAMDTVADEANSALNGLLKGA